MDESTVLPCGFCGQKLRVPETRGTVSVTCPKCRYEFDYEPSRARGKTSRSDSFQEGRPKAARGIRRAAWLRQTPFFGLGFAGLLALLFVVYNAGLASGNARTGAVARAQEKDQSVVPNVQGSKEPSAATHTAVPTLIPTVASNVDELRPIPPIKALALKPIRVPKIDYKKSKVPEYKPVSLMRLPKIPKPIAVAEASLFDPKATRPPSGTMLTNDSKASEKGVFTATNGSNLDAAVYLVPVGEQEATVAFYVRADKEYKAEGIPDGTYNVFVRTGRDWHEDTQSFANGESLTRFEESFAFETHDDGSMIHSARWMVTLHPMIGGNAKSRPVSASEFPTANKVRH